ncbi:MAG: SEC-C metal-binding domain-containing protein [Anaeromyxobacteraceae bacterium]
MRALPTPEQSIDTRDAPLALTLTCNRCGRRQSRKFDWACIDPRDERDDGWDGVLLSRIVECSGCGAIDDYALAGTSYLQLTGRLLRALDKDAGTGRIILGVSQLWDGSVARRPSTALARLRQLAADHPERAEGFRRLGNGCERFGFVEEALAAWKKALELDPAELESACLLASHAWSGGQREETLRYLRRGLQAVLRATELGRDVLDPARHLATLLHEVAGRDPEPLGLLAAWFEGEMGGQRVAHASAVDLRKVSDPERLADFLVRPGLVGVELSSELPAGEPTHLEQVLSSALPRPRRPQPTGPSPVAREHTPDKVGRNAPCPCGSGKKHKRCCGG